MLPIRLFLLPLLLAGPLLSFSQDILWLEKPPFKRVMVNPGDSIVVKFLGEDFPYSYRYGGARGDFIYVRGDSIPAADIGEMWVRRSRASRYWLGMMAGNGIAVAVFTPVGALLNVPLSNWTRREGVIVGAAFVGGLAFAKLMRRLVWKRYRFKAGAWRLAVRPRIEDSVAPVN